MEGGVASLNESELVGARCREKSVAGTFQSSTRSCNRAHLNGAKAVEAKAEKLQNGKHVRDGKK